MAENHNRDLHRAGMLKGQHPWYTFEIYPMSKGDIQDLYVCQGSMWKNTSPDKIRLYPFEVKMNIINNMPLMVPEVSTTLRTPEPKADHESSDMSILQK